MTARVTAAAVVEKDGVPRPAHCDDDDDNDDAANRDATLLHLN